MQPQVATHADTPWSATTARPVHKVMIVNGSSEILEVLETVLDAGRYDVVFVESSGHAYSQIKRVHPDLVILCVRIDEPASFQVLSMLKLDEDTREIPILTYTAESGNETVEPESAELNEADVFAAKPVAWMN